MLWYFMFLGLVMFIDPQISIAFTAPIFFTWSTLIFLEVIVGFILGSKRTQLQHEAFVNMFIIYAVTGLFLGFVQGAYSMYQAFEMLGG